MPLQPAWSRATGSKADPEGPPVARAADRGCGRADHRLRQAYQPQGLAPIAPWWRFREQYTGTYDETWLATRHPFLPPDFDYRFYNCAHPDLIFTPWLHGDEEIRLANLRPDAPLLAFSLPGLRLVCAAHRKIGETEILAMPLDGVHIDVVQPPLRVTLTWRVGFAWREGVRAVEAHLLGPAEPMSAASRQPLPAETGHD